MPAALMFHLHKVSISITCMVLCLFSISHKAYSQRVPLGVSEAMAESELTIEDPTFGNNQHYKILTLEVKGGEGIWVFMETSAFEPQVFITDLYATTLTTGEHESYFNGWYLSYITFNPSRDTTIAILFSSLDPGSLGKFTYGVKKFSAEQMTYQYDFTYCEKLNYMINHWMASWYLYEMFYNDDVYTGDIGTMAKHTLTEDSEGYLENYVYTELIHYGYQESEALVKYITHVAEITACLDTTIWDIQAVELNGTRTTYFTIKGNEIKTPQASFAITNYADDTFYRTDLIMY